jgi:hypothetical protein
LAPFDFLLSSVVLGELATGVIKSAWPERNRKQLLALVKHLELVPVDRAVALAYAQIRATLEPQGTPIGANDLLAGEHPLACAAQASVIAEAFRIDQQVARHGGCRSRAASPGGPAERDARLPRGLWPGRPARWWRQGGHGRAR